MTMPITMVTSLSQAQRAYGGSSPASLGGASSLGASDTASGPSFGSIVGNAMSDAIATLHNSEHIQALGVAGKTDVQSVVQAASDAEVTVQAMTSIIGKAQSAYNDVLRMSV